MAQGNKKKSELKHHSDVEEFIPYAAHFDEETLVTKNGELLQVIKVTGFNFEVIKEEKDDIKPLRALVREVLKKTITDDSYSFWIHTIRREADISTEGSYKQKLCNDINEKWVANNKLRTQFINELYITIIKEGDIFPLRNIGALINNLFINTELKARNIALIEAQKKLSAITNSIIDGLKGFGARKLSIYKNDGIYYSEILSLVSKIMNLRQDELPLAPSNLSSMLPTKTVNFQYNTIQVEGETKKHFGAVYSLKEYREITLDELDKLMQLPVNLIISQSFCFVSKQVATAAFEDQKKIYELSNSKYMAEISGIKEAFDEEASEATGYGEQQITITVLEDTVKALQSSVFIVVDTLRDMGLFCVREDLFMENCYWSMMPANFDFIFRKTYLPFQRLGGFASLHNFITGKYKNNRWGNAVTTFFTSKGMPYFFNFHYEKNGHTIIVGEDAVEKSLLIKFLISQAQKYDTKTFFVEAEKSSEIFISAIGGKYYEASTFSLSANDRPGVVGVNVKAGPDEVINILNSIELSLDSNAPALVYIDDSITSINDQGLSEYLSNWMKKLTEKNAMVIFSAKTNLTYKQPGIFLKNLTDLIETKIFLPNPTADFSYKEVFYIKEKELKAVKGMVQEENEVMIKRHLDSVVVKFNLGNIRKMLAAFSDNQENHEALKKCMEEAGSDNPENWLVPYYSKMNL